MIRFLLAALAAMAVGGTLSVLWRERRRQFWPALGVVLLAVAAIVGYVTWWMPANDRGAIPPAQLRLEGLSLDEVAGSFRLRARLQNLSPDRVVVRLPVRLVVEHCANPADATTCSVRGDRTQAVLVTVAPGATREFYQVYPLDGRIPADHLRWHAEAGAAESRAADDDR